ncbi:hypothetical protein [Ligilactobacillus apodemi]|uniref:hypothetical protein n=1 Tax=Ligilactobacillus apodemi TaxID=307126 RepID=UPI00214AABB6|nr:hypothetical protein [Ligilactobacillus apodemi]MCR1900663.1 hypothetical protein [Ligilactobacillus apodemi]
MRKNLKIIVITVLGVLLLSGAVIIGEAVIKEIRDLRIEQQKDESNSESKQEKNESK